MVIAVVALALAFAGPGSLSLDALPGEAMSGPLWGLAALLVSVLGAVISLLARCCAGRAQHSWLSDVIEASILEVQGRKRK